jgi:predicted DNA-binding transcriptional regulator AlpA
VQVNERAARAWSSAIMTARALSDIRPVPRRGLSRNEAAMYIGISAGKFDELVGDGRMPAPRRIDGRKVWDVRELDLAFEAFPLESDDAAEDWNAAV